MPSMNLSGFEVVVDPALQQISTVATGDAKQAQGDNHLDTTNTGRLLDSALWEWSAPESKPRSRVILKNVPAESSDLWGWKAPHVGRSIPDISRPVAAEKVPEEAAPAIRKTEEELYEWSAPTYSPPPRQAISTFCDARNSNDNNNPWAW